MAFFTSRADLNVGIVNQYVLNSNGIVQGQGQQIIDFYDPTGGLPADPDDGDRYISEATANGWIENYIEVYDATLDTWKNMEPVPGTIAWVDGIAAPQLQVWNSTNGAWEPLTGSSSTITIESFDTPGTTVNDVPADVTTVRVTMWGGGGSGGICNSNEGSGGGGSSMAIVGFTRQVTPGAGLMTVTVGAGGTLGNQGDNSVVAYSGSNPFTITAYGGAPGGTNDPGQPGGGGGGAGAGSVGNAGIPTGTGLGGNVSVTYPIVGPAGGFGGDDEVTDGAAAQPGNQGQQSGFVIAGSGGGGAGSLGGAIGGSNVGGSGGAVSGTAGSGAAGFGGPGADGASNTLGEAGADAADNSGAGGGGSSNNGAPGAGGSGKVILEYF